VSRQLRKCHVCSEWFNTTPAIMIEHYQKYHEKGFEKARAIAEMVVNIMHYQTLARVTPFPLNIQHHLAEVTCRAQLEKIIAYDVRL